MTVKHAEVRIAKYEEDEDEGKGETVDEDKGEHKRRRSDRTEHNDGKNAARVEGLVLRGVRGNELVAVQHKGARRSLAQQEPVGLCPAQAFCVDRLSAARCV